MLNKLTEFVLANRWRGEAFCFEDAETGYKIPYTNEQIMWEIATHSASFTGCAFVEEADGTISGLVTALPLSTEHKTLYVRNILCTTPYAFRRLVDTLVKVYGPEWILYAHRNGKTKRIGVAARLNKLVK